MTVEQRRGINRADSASASTNDVGDARESAGVANDYLSGGLDAAHIAGVPAAAPLFGGPPTSQRFTRVRAAGWATRAPVVVLCAAVLGIIVLGLQWTGVMSTMFDSGTTVLLLLGFLGPAAVAGSALVNKESGVLLSTAIVGLTMGISGVVTIWSSGSAIDNTGGGAWDLLVALLLFLKATVAIAGVFTGIGWAVRWQMARKTPSDPV